MSSNFLTVTLPSILMALLVLVAITISLEDEPELRLVNVVFRHGDRAPSKEEVYPKDPYRNLSFYPMGRAGLTNAGKLRAYRLGQELKSRYGKLLSPIYVPPAIEARSTDVDRTKMTLQLVLSALYPPAPIQTWNEYLPWQPIPATYRRRNEDVLFGPELCPKYFAELSRVRASPEVQAELAKFSNLTEYLEKNTGLSIKSTYDMYFMYNLLTAERAVDLTLPDWTAAVYPDGLLRDGASLEYEVVSYNEKLKRLNGGMFVRKISEDLTAYRNGTLPAGRRAYLYSGHETNIASLQMALGVFEPHVPKYTSAVMVELRQLKDQYFVKVLYYTGIPAKVVTKKIPGCAELCPLNTFLELMRPVTPSDSDLICPNRRIPSQLTPSSLSDASREKVAL